MFPAYRSERHDRRTEAVESTVAPGLTVE
jgi:hypothetical protein